MSLQEELRKYKLRLFSEFRMYKMPSYARGKRDLGRLTGKNDRRSAGEGKKGEGTADND